MEPMDRPQLNDAMQCAARLPGGPYAAAGDEHWVRAAGDGRRRRGAEQRRAPAALDLDLDLDLELGV